jgi:hypothetical protein
MKDTDSQLIDRASDPIEPEEHNLKGFSEEELFGRILESGHEWTEEERQRVTDAYELGKMLHKDDVYRNKPYVYHLLRNANRIISYFHVTDPDVIIGALLHDSVEDHPREILQWYASEEDDELDIPASEAELQEAALARLEMSFSPRSAEIVRGMTNPPAPEGVQLTYGEKMRQYLEHIEIFVRDVGVWLNKLSDWGDNGLGIVHSDFQPGSSRRVHYRIKYGNVLPILKRRFLEPDIQETLDPVAKANVMRMFTLAEQRLLVDKTQQQIATAAVEATVDQH